MLFKVKNLGVIAEAEVDLSKDLILLTGQNNTGKTYLAYLAYFLMAKITGINYVGNNLKKLIDELPTINMDSFLLPNKEYYIFDYSYLNIFYSSAKISKDIKVSISFSETDLNIAKAKEDAITIGKEIYLYKAANSSNIEYKGGEIKKDEVSITVAGDFFKSNLNTFCEDLFFRHNNCFLFTSERNGINIFSKELAIFKNKLFDKILELNNRGLLDLARYLSDLAQKNINRYPQPIKDSLRIAEDLQASSRQTSSFSHLAEELENTILKGKVVLGEYGDLRYTPNGVENNLEIHLTSSLVKSLSPIAFYLRHLAQANDCIIIDEPELNLHPDNQVLVARFLGRLVNEGFKVIVSTHSDYIIKEINNLVMLSKTNEASAELLTKYGYSSKQTICPEQIEALLFRLPQNKAGVVPEKIQVTATGLSINTIDEVIDQLENRAEDIYYQLFEN